LLSLPLFTTKKVQVEAELKSMFVLGSVVQCPTAPSAMAAAKFRCRETTRGQSIIHRLAMGAHQIFGYSMFQHPIDV
jgi:hypothetical protein